MKTAKLKLEPYRFHNPMYPNAGDANNGCFMVKSPKDRESMMVIISDGMGWEHVSVSRRDRTPTWEEMCFIKDMVFNDDEIVVQYHPAKTEYVNNHPHCLHMWKPTNAKLPAPPSILVGIK